MKILLFLFIFAFLFVNSLSRIKSLESEIQKHSESSRDTPNYPQLQCRNRLNDNVDWWFVYKMPKSASLNSSNNEGYNYFYADQNTPFSEAPDTLHSNTGPIEKTVHDVYEESSESNDIAWIQYNDDPPDDATGYIHHYGHAKGFVALGAQSGFWLIHSVPRYPSIHSKPYEYPEEEIIYGQSFLCISLNPSEYETVSQALLLNQVTVYDENLTPSFLQTKAPTFLEISKGASPGEEKHKDFSIYSRGGKPFIIYAKSKQWNDELYSKFVAISLQHDLVTETWMRPELPSYCEYPYTVEDILSLRMGDYAFKYTQDHSKVALTKTGSFVCVGDINRMTSQANRGGGTICFSYESLHDKLLSSIVDLESCS